MAKRKENTAEETVKPVVEAEVKVAETIKEEPKAEVQEVVVEEAKVASVFKAEEVKEETVKIVKTLKSFNRNFDCLWNGQEYDY